MATKRNKGGRPKGYSPKKAAEEKALLSAKQSEERLADAQKEREEAERLAQEEKEAKAKEQEQEQQEQEEEEQLEEMTPLPKELEDEINNLKVEEQKPEPIKEEVQVKEVKSENAMDLIKELQREINELKSKQTQTPHVIVQTKEDNKFGSALKKEIPASDRLDRPVTFTTRSQGFLMSVYMKDGTEVYPPYNRGIEFVFSAADVKAGGKAEDVIYISTFRTWSKMEVEYIKQSPFYNSTIFDNLTETMNIDQKLVSSIEAASTYVTLLSDDVLFSIASKYGMDMSEGVNKIREKVKSIKLKEILEEEDYFKKELIKRHESVGQ